MLALLITALIVGVVLGIMALGAFGITLFGGWLFAGENNPEKTQKKYQAKLAKKFNGSDTVTWDVGLTPNATPTEEQLIEDAKACGYELEQSTRRAKYVQTLVFKPRSNINLIDRVAPYLEEN